MTRKRIEIEIDVRVETGDHVYINEIARVISRIQSVKTGHHVYIGELANVISRTLINTWPNPDERDSNN